MNKDINPSATFTFPIRIYYEDTDSGGVVYYANYLKFLERARTEWLRDMSFEQTELLDRYNVLFVVRRVEIDYLRPAVFNDALSVTVQVHNAGRSWIELDQTVVRGAEVLVTARVKIVCVNGQSFKPVGIPPAIKEKMENKQ